MLNYFGLLIKDLFFRLPFRIWRLLLYLLEGGKELLAFRVRRSRIWWWWFGLVLLLLDTLGIVEIYEGFATSLKTNTRPLTEEEIQRAKPIFGNTINYGRVRIDERARLGPKQYQFCYVSFHTINSWGEMRDDVLIHELVHVWQYERFGALYIAKALLAQWDEGYNYGGRKRLTEVRTEGGKLTSFNFEQQADIVMDHYRLITGRSTRWGNATLTDISEYEYFVDQLVKPS